MPKKKQITIRLDEDLYKLVKLKCKRNLGIGISPLIKIFMISTTLQANVVVFAKLA